MSKETKMSREELEKFYRFAVGRITDLECDVSSAEQRTQVIEIQLMEVRKVCVHHGFKPQRFEAHRVVAIDRIFAIIGIEKE